MYGDIVFYTHGSTIEYGGEIFVAAELTADILNFAPEDYRPIQRLLNRTKESGVEKARDQSLKRLRDRYRNSFAWELRRARQMVLEVMCTEHLC